MSWWLLIRLKLDQMHSCIKPVNFARTHSLKVSLPGAGASEQQVPGRCSLSSPKARIFRASGDRRSAAWYSPLGSWASQGNLLLVALVSPADMPFSGRKGAAAVVSPEQVSRDSDKHDLLVTCIQDFTPLNLQRLLRLRKADKACFLLVVLPVCHSSPQ